MKVLVSDPITDSGMAILNHAGLDVVYLPDNTQEEKADAAKDAHGWVVRSGTKATADMISGADKLRVIGRAGVGVDNIDIEAATRQGVIVMNTPNVNTVSAAEHTVAMMLALSRNIPMGHCGLEKGEWNRNALVGTELLNKTLGVVGLGKIGREVIQRCRAFQMKIIGFDPFISQEMFNPDEVKVVELDELTTEADYITLHVPLSDSTRDLFNYKRLSQMKPTARIVNVARGGIINEEDLARALHDKKIAGAAVDVYMNEPIDKTNPLVGTPNMVLTPHLGASTEEAKEGVSKVVCEQVRDYLINEKMTNALNMPLSDLTKLKEMQPHLELAEIMGKLQAQMVSHAIQKVQVVCYGSMDEPKPAALAFLKGLLHERVPEKINYINAETLAVDLGIEIEHSFSSDTGSYTNLICSTVFSGETEMQLNGSIFGGKRKHLVNILGYEMDINPTGTMLFVRNKDVPGVVGKIGSILGQANVNIGAYILSRDNNDGEAFAVVRVDTKLDKELLKSLSMLPEILSIRQLHC